MSVEIKFNTCYKNGNRCIHNGSAICNKCGVMTGNVKKPILFEPERMEVTT